MRKKVIYVTYSHYDEEGHRSRLVKPVKAEIIKRSGYIFGLYRDREEKIWKLVDVLSGMSITQNKKKQEAVTRIDIPAVFEKYEEIVKDKTYKDLVAEHLRLTIPHIWERRYDGPREEEVEIAPGLIATVRGNTFTYVLPSSPYDVLTLEMED